VLARNVHASVAQLWYSLVGRLLGLGRRRGDIDGQATDALAIQDKLSVALREIKKNQPGSRIEIYQGY